MNMQMKFSIVKINLAADTAVAAALTKDKRIGTMSQITYNKAVWNCNVRINRKIPFIAILRFVS